MIPLWEVAGDGTLPKNGKKVLNFAEMLDIPAEFDIITVAFQRQQVELVP